MKRVTILGDPVEYKGFHIFLQCYGELFQGIIFKEGSFYQFHNQIKMPKGRKKWRKPELDSATTYLMTQAVATCEAIIHKNNPEELLKQHSEAAAIVETLEKNIN